MLVRNSYLSLPKLLYRETQPQPLEPLESPELIVFNHSLGDELMLRLGKEGLDTAVLAGNKVLVNSKPIALAYAGHQFGQFVPQLGDGRAVLLGQFRHRNGRDYDVQLKGSGETVYSRNGDGRAPLDAVIREYLVSEFMHAVGIPTTRSLAAVSAPLVLQRHNGVLPAGVLTRVAASHIRVGTFEYLARHGKFAELKCLYEYAVARHYPELSGVNDKVVEFFSQVCASQAYLIARWMLVGFIHGVMNTDNMAISGETIDYGPCAFLDEYEPQAVFSSIDYYGRYAYCNQASIGAWNLSRLAECLLPLCGNADHALDKFNALIDDYQTQLHHHWVNGMQQKLGLPSMGEDESSLIHDYLELLRENRVDYNLSFRVLAEVLSDAESGQQQFVGLIGNQAKALEWLTRWLQKINTSTCPRDDLIQSMNAVNPLLVPRNHVIQIIIDKAVSEQDFTLFHQFLDAIKAPFEDRGHPILFRSLPRESERIQQTFCGT